MQRLSLETWKNIFNNLKDMDEEDYYDGVQSWVEPIYLDPIKENESKWGLAYGEELFEEGFETEEEARQRLEYLESKILGGR